MRALPVIAALVLFPGCPPADGPCQTSDDCTRGRGCCDGRCVDLQNDSKHCGACGAVCEAANAVSTCRGGVCQLQCAAGWGNCNGNRADGCEQSLSDSPTSCGRCDTVCTAINAAPVCIAALCRAGECLPGFGDCNDNEADGCEVDTRVDLLHCGGCRRPCALPNATAACVASACAVAACTAPFADCDGAPANGCEVDTQSDAQHCGRCGAACWPGQACVAGRCRADELLVFGGGLGFTVSATTNQVHRFDVAARAWTQLSPATPDGLVPSRGRHVAAWDQPRNRMLVWGGVDGTGAAVAPDVWALDLGATPVTWRRLATTGTPPSPRFAPAAALDEAAGVLYLFGGTTELGAGLSDLHRLDLATLTWTRVHGDDAPGAPGARLNAAGAFDPVARRFLVFGGNAQATSGDLDELWQFDVASQAWRTPPATGLENGPTGRARPAFFSGHPAHLFGGAAALLQPPPVLYDDLRRFTASPTPAWSVVPAAGPEARFNAAHASLDGDLFLFGGGILGASGLQAAGDTWTFSVSSGAWTRLHDGTGTTPAGRLGATMVAR